MARPPKPKDISSLTHDEAKRVNNPTAEMASLYEQQVEQVGERPKAIKLPRARPLAEGEMRERDADLDPQIVWNGMKITLTPAQRDQLVETGTVEIGDAQLTWRGKDRQDWSDLIVNAPPLYIQEKVHPKAIIDDLKRRSKATQQATTDAPDLFADFNGLPDPEARAEFYRHSMHWQNRFILGDSLQVMASLAQREAMKGKVQCIYFDPPYGIKFNSNWQVSTQSRDVKDGKQADMSREPEQVKAFRDTWKDGIHSYLTYLRDRLSVARELLTESGSIFVQIGDENVHRVRALMDEVFGAENCISQIQYRALTPLGSRGLSNVYDFVLWYAKDKAAAKYRNIQIDRPIEDEPEFTYVDDGSGYWTKVDVLPPDSLGVFKRSDLKSSGYTPTCIFDFEFEGRLVRSKGRKSWRTNRSGMERLIKANRLFYLGDGSIYFRQHFSDSPLKQMENTWFDTAAGFTDTKTYVVQTNEKIIQRCVLMTTDPGDLVLDPTCGSGTTATVAEQWGRRWITVDTSRVALALARTRLMSARYPYYLLADSPSGREKEGALAHRIPSSAPTAGDLRQGFVLRRESRVTLGAIANNSRIDDIWEQWQTVLEPLRAELNAGLARGGVAWEEWQIPRNLDAWLDSKEGKPHAGLVSAKLRALHADWWKARIARQKEIDAAIAQAADVELLYDRPYEDKNIVRVAGPFTVESLSPHRVATARDDSLGPALEAGEGALQPDPANVPEADFGVMVLENLRAAGVHQKDKADTIKFNSIEPWPGKWLAAEARYPDGEKRERRAGVLIGPEFGTLTRSHITAAAREASEARFDALIACAFNFEAQASDLNQLGPLPILKARMNPDLHMSDELKSTGKGNLFVVFGEPDITLLDTPEGEIRVRVNGVDVFDPSTGEIRSDGKEGIAAWFIDTDYNEESFFVRHAYFLGANDPYKSLKTALRAEIDEEAWGTLYSDTSRPFARPATGFIAVKVINHFGDEVLKVFGV